MTKEIWAWAVGDFDNNGFDDVLIKDYDNYTLGDTAMCYLSIGDGEFADPISVPGFLWQVGGFSRTIRMSMTTIWTAIWILRLPQMTPSRCISGRGTGRSQVHGG